MSENTGHVERHPSAAMSAQRLHRWFHVIAAVMLAWLLMMAAHEAGHVVAAICSGGKVQKVELSPLAFSRTDVDPNPHPLFVAWAGFVGGVAIPLAAWAACMLTARTWVYLARFFSGFCFIANG
ncbi:MAG: hypothetical protein EHM48_10555, partial [Planctomycetaceae bacterium]